MSKYTRTRERQELRAADGTVLNYSVNEHMIARGYLDGFPGATLVTVFDEVEVCPYERVLIDSGIGEEHWPLLRADMGRFLNMTADAGRPSDAMRSAVRAFKNGTLTPESFAAATPKAHYSEENAR